jgi:5-methylcytosine-specific restriction protein A
VAAYIGAMKSTTPGLVPGSFGILTPVEAPVVIVVTGEEGGQYGYDDFWDEGGVFHYYGAGQRGDIVFRSGNLSVYTA